MAKHAIARLDEIDELVDMEYRYLPVRHHLGITAFGATAWVGAEAGDPIINEYDEGSVPSEELFFVVSGRATFEIEGEEVDSPAGTLLSTQPGTQRTALAVEPGTTILVLDGTPGKAYDATGWELWAPLVPLYADGEYAALNARLREVIAANPQYPMLTYNLACSESMNGDTAQAIEHLRQAIDGNAKHREDARTDSDLDALRDEPAFRELLEDDE
jgi:tetratricopeptide (TPR) repeat protein